MITLWADTLNSSQKLTIFQTAWYYKPYPTFSDAVASVRYRIWQFQFSARLLKKIDRAEINHDFINHLAFMAARAT